jgi:phenylalanyl-tRNA synthetase beta subunit
VLNQFTGGNLPADKKSIAIRLQLQDASATLTDIQADAAMSAALASVQGGCGATLR